MIAAARRDFLTFQMLLEAGVDPDSYGDKNGISWGPDILLNKIRTIGQSAREIVWSYDGNWANDVNLIDEEFVQVNGNSPENIGRIRSLLEAYDASR